MDELNEVNINGTLNKLKKAELSHTRTFMAQAYLTCSTFVNPFFDLLIYLLIC